MPHGPTLTFDKSFLQSINPDEAVWLDHFFSCNITPLFFIETLADIEKEVHKGRTPEQIVGQLAYKTPDMHSQMNPFHLNLLEGELMGVRKVPMDGRIFKARGQPVVLSDQKGIVYKKSPEEEALYRWQAGEFLDVERQYARFWRRSVIGIDHSQSYAAFGQFYARIPKPKDLPSVKKLAETFVDALDQEHALRFGMQVLSVPPLGQHHVFERWTAAGKPPIKSFAPYFRHVYLADLFFHLAVAADLISRVRPKGKADNMVDIAYLYYLPFCRIFTSSDNLHERVVPLFLRDDQTYVKGADLKEDLRHLDEHYSALPDDVKAKGFYAFASEPPQDTSFLVTQLWDKHQPRWRDEQSKPKQLEPELQKALVDLVAKFAIESKPELDPSAHPKSIEEVDFIHDERKVMGKKGKWMRIPPRPERC